METDLIITNVHTVFEGEFKPGALSRKSAGRHSDCFVVFLYGKAVYRFDGYAFTVTPKDFIFLAKDSLYQIEIAEKSKYICVDFDFASSEEPRKSCVFRNVSPTVKNSFRKMFYNWNKKEPWYMSQILGTVYELYTEGLRSGYRGQSRQNETFASLASYVLEHYCEPDFSVGELAAHSGFSEVHLRRVFQSAVNTSPVRYVNYLRLEKAKNMLTASNFSISEIAQSVGFSDPYYFSRLFKKEVGIAPAEYRKQG